MNKKHRDLTRPSSAPNTRNNNRRHVRPAWQEEDYVEEVRKGESGNARGPSSSEESLMHAIHVMQNKYSQNIEVIGKQYKI